MLRMGNNITVQKVRYLHGSTVDGLKIQRLNEEIINIFGTGIILIVIITSLVIHILSLKKVI